MYQLLCVLLCFISTDANVLSHAVTAASALHKTTVEITWCLRVPHMFPRYLPRLNPEVLRTSPQVRLGSEERVQQSVVRGDALRGVDMQQLPYEVIEVSLLASACPEVSFPRCIPGECDNPL